MNMELKLRILVEGLYLYSFLLWAFLFQESASGLGLPSLLLASSLSSLKSETFSRSLLLQNDHAFVPLSPRTSPEPKRQRFRPLPPISQRKRGEFGMKAHHSVPKASHGLPRSPFSREEPIASSSLASLHYSHRWTSKKAQPLHENPQVSSSSPTGPPIFAPPLLSSTLLPLPPRQGCASLTCTEPLTYSSPGGPCSCVWPIEVKLCFSIPLHSFLPLLSELVDAIATNIPLNRSQVRIMGVDVANEHLDKTTALVNLVPLEEMFKSTAAYSIYSMFWKRELSIKTSLFGAYDILYVRYPGLPPSPPSWISASAAVDTRPYPSSGNDDEPIKPLGVDVPLRRKNTNKNVAIIVILSTTTAFVACIGFMLLLLSKCGCCGYLYRRDHRSSISSNEKPSGVGRLPMLRSRPSSATSMSYSSSVLVYTGTAKIFSVEDLERATDGFDSSRILGEGGFGLVYGGVIDDGRNVAVKVLKREDQQGGREFLAEVEMLSRLHHRNLVKLIGICPEDQCRCLVYELVPNGSVYSHLHGADREANPLDWCARLKIALGSARGLAYLHEDSSPRVIHRDFKSSNILLEHDYMPKVSDFGLAKSGMDEASKHISTHVMGTFGYLAPEYAMTGHLLVKSDVYSFGVVLLELLTGRSPVDMSRPQGQENTVTWARSLLATKQGMETIIDPALKPDVPLGSFAKVAAIASMCLQPEVSHRPFMGEVVQALKLVCDECGETREPALSRSRSQEEFFMDMESKHGQITEELAEELARCESMFDANVALSAGDREMQELELESESFRRQFNSAPLKAAETRPNLQPDPAKGSMSQHGFLPKMYYQQ